MKGSYKRPLLCGNGKILTFYKLPQLEQMSHVMTQFPWLHNLSYFLQRMQWVGYQRFHFSLWFLLQIRFRFIDRLEAEVPLLQKKKLDIIIS